MTDHPHHWIGTHDHGPVCSVCGMSKPEAQQVGERSRWLYQGIRPRWIPLRWWSRAFTDGYRAACADVVAGFVDPASPDGPDHA